MEIQTKRLIIYLILPLMLLAAAVLIADYQTKSDHLLHVKFYDLSGRSIFIRTASGTKVLIDGGATDQVLTKLGASLPFYDRDIDLVVLTSPSSDRVSGLVDVLKRFHVKQVALPDIKFSSSAYQELNTLIAQNKMKKTFIAEGDRLWLDPVTVLDIYAPGAGEIDPTQVSDLSSSQALMRLSFGSNKIFFAGNIDPAQQLYLPKQFDLSSDALELEPGTNAFTLNPDFMTSVNPKFLVVEGSTNKLNLGPTSAGFQTLSTSDGHDIELVSDGKKLYKY